MKSVLAVSSVLIVFVNDSTTLETDDGDILLDYSKNLITEDVMSMLVAMVTHVPLSATVFLWVFKKLISP